MERFPLLRDGESVGELTAEREGLYTCFSARVHLPEGLWCVWLIGERGELRLGVPEPQEGRSVIRRRFSGRMTAPLGRLLRGEVRPVAGGDSEWRVIPRPVCLFRTGWLRRQLEPCGTALLKREEERLLLAVPYDEEQPFLLPALFCFAHIRRIRDREYAVFAFDREEKPLFLEKFCRKQKESIQKNAK